MRLTAAHKTLPLPTHGAGDQSGERPPDPDPASMTAGPSSNNRIIDLSRRAAQLLGMEQQGTAKVRVQIMAEESRATGAGGWRRPGCRAPKPTAAPAPKVTTEALAGLDQPPAPAARRPAQAGRAWATCRCPSRAPWWCSNRSRPTNLFIQAGAFLQIAECRSPAGQAFGRGCGARRPGSIGRAKILSCAPGTDRHGGAGRCHAQPGDRHG